MSCGTGEVTLQCKLADRRPVATAGRYRGRRGLAGSVATAGRSNGWRGLAGFKLPTRK